ncbi:uncharacterized protein CCOS01_12403 [Colletotrichum costaricense]|uniref:Uncharacterized protein n=1 Tax=Colletotrichum costaricense TaxID=1209916 RepID=A0AAI9YNC0_9PEZI|nr:uncharacterized protein CCOS01_12403 [Colletotrichum costaricense]KAK1516854.1 hypothetical protein CCOS01_12403 [Colletotrichum costaricense]
MEKKREEDEQQQIYNRVRVEAEFNERRRIETEAQEVRDQEAATIEQMNAMERSIRGKLEAEKWAEEAEKKAKARQIEETARLSREKMMEAMEDIATLTKEKVLDDIANERQIDTAKRGEHDFMMTELLSELRAIIRSDLRQEIRSEVRREIEEEEYEARTGRPSRHYWRYRQDPSTPRYTTPEPRRRSPRPERYREASYGTAYRYRRYREPQDGRYPRAPMVHSSDDESRRHNEEGIASPVSSHFGSYHHPVPEPRLRRRSRQEYRIPSSNGSSRGSATDPVVHHMEQPEINLNAANVNQPPARRSASRRKYRESNDRGLVVYIPATSEFEPPPIGSLAESTTAFGTQHDPEIELSSRPNKVEEVEVWNDVETRSLSPTDSSYQTPSEV